MNQQIKTAGLGTIGFLVAALICAGFTTYLVAMLFILFDIEAIFLYPWAAVHRWLGVFGLVEMGIFVLIVLVGYNYIWKRGAFQWES